MIPTPDLSHLTKAELEDVYDPAGRAQLLEVMQTLQLIST
jgi:hypothetical protein